MLEWRLVFDWLSGAAAIVFRFTSRESHVGELCFEFRQMPTCRRVNDHCLVPTGTLNLSHAVTESLEPSSGLRRTDIHEQLVAF
jgi:hypothetical protein